MAEPTSGAESQEKKPSLHLVGSKDDLPTLDDILALTKALTGRDPTPEEIAEARNILDEPEPAK